MIKAAGPTFFPADRPPFPGAARDKKIPPPGTRLTRSAEQPPWRSFFFFPPFPPLFSSIIGPQGGRWLKPRWSPGGWLTSSPFPFFFFFPSPFAFRLPRHGRMINRYGAPPLPYPGFPPPHFFFTSGPGLQPTLVSAIDAERGLGTCRRAAVRPFPVSHSFVLFQAPPDLGYGGNGGKRCYPSYCNPWSFFSLPPFPVLRRQTTRDGDSMRDFFSLFPSFLHTAEPGRIQETKPIFHRQRFALPPFFIVFFFFPLFFPPFRDRRIRPMGTGIGIGRP